MCSLLGILCISQVVLCRGDRIRTCGLSVPNRALYQAELRPGVKRPLCTLRECTASVHTAKLRTARENGLGKSS